jgi:PAS domain S-box-containing protein
MQNANGINDHVTSCSRIPEADELNQAFFDYAPCGMVATDFNGRFLRVNDAFCGLVGYSAAELVELTIADVTHPDDRVQEAQRLSSYFSSGASYESDKRYVRKDGSVCWVHVKARMKIGADGQREYSIGIVQDISDRQFARAVEAALHESEEEFRQVFENASIGIAISDIAGGLQRFNPAFCRLTGYTPEELQDERFPSLVHPDDRSENVKQVERMLKGEIQSFEIENRYVHKDGNPIWVRKYNYLLMDRSGYPRRMIALVSDISKRKQQEEHIQLLMQEVNHRAKNIFSVVLAVARESAKARPDSFLERFAERIQALAANHQLLTKSQWQGVDIEPLIRGQMAHFEDLFDRRIHFKGERLRISTAAAQTVGMAVHELATNASKYGSLSNLSGRVGIEWGVDRDQAGDPRFHLSWRETGGPTVAKPDRRGFGSTVIDQMVRMGLNANVSLDYKPLGLTWVMSCEAARAVESDAS